MRQLQPRLGDAMAGKVQGAVKAHKKENNLKPGVPGGFLKEWHLNYGIRESDRWTFQLNFNLCRKNTD